MSAVSTPAVSVVVATYNRAPLLLRSLESVRAQTFSDWECLICDDGSIDDTPALVASLAGQDPRFKWLPGPRHGLPAGPRNRGIRSARGEWIAFIDDDDLWHPQKLERQMGDLSERDEAISVPSQSFPDGTEPIWNRGSISAQRLTLEHVLLQCDPYPTTPATMVRRSRLIDVGGFAESSAFRAVEDFDLWCRLLARRDVQWRMLGGCPLVAYRDLGVDSISAWSRPLRPDAIRQRWCAMEVSSRMLAAATNADRKAVAKALATFAEDCAGRCVAVGWKMQALAAYAIAGFAAAEERQWRRSLRHLYRAVRRLVGKSPTVPVPPAVMALTARALQNCMAAVGLQHVGIDDSISFHGNSLSADALR